MIEDGTTGDGAAATGSVEGQGLTVEDATTEEGAAATGSVEGQGLTVEDGTTGDGAAATGSVEGQGLTVEEVMEALGNVIDPELGLDFVELGLIYGVEIDGADVHVAFTLTTPGCPIGPQVTEQIEEFVGEVDGVRNVDSELVFTPPWSPERMTEDAKFALGY